MAGLHGRAATVDLGRPGRIGTHTRQPSDIDGLSPEVVAALQSTFGQKLNDLRSQSSLRRQTPEPKPSPLQPPPEEEEGEEEAQEVKEVVDSENEGTFLVVAYAAGIVASILILVTAGAAKPEGDVSCKGFGDSKCVRLYGLILPIGVTGFGLILALVLSVFDLSFGVYNVLKTTENFFQAASFRLSDIPQVAISYMIDVGFVAVAISLLWIARTATVDPLFTLCEEGIKVFWTFGLITMGTVIFWCAANSINDPTASYLFMRRAAKIVLVLFLLFGGSSLLYNMVAPPQPSSLCQTPQVNGTGDTQLQAYYKGWLYEIPDPESKQVQLYTEAHEFHWRWCPSDSRPALPPAKPHVCEPKDHDMAVCPARYDDGGTCEAKYDRGTCEAKYDRGTCEARYDQGMCEARYDQQTCKPKSEQGVCPPRGRHEICEALEWEECQWPWLKRIEVYERKEKCKYDLPVCEWPLAKRLQIYESEEVCKYECPSCDWPLVKRIQVYSRSDRCGGLTHPECDWPYLKQIQQYERKGRCSRKDLPQCNWPFIKQIQSHDKSSCCSTENLTGDSGKPINVVTN